MTMLLEQPLAPGELVSSLERSGYGWMAPESTGRLTGLDAAAWERLRRYWSTLPRDPHLKDGGRYRARRHASLVYDVTSAELQLRPHRAHWQPLEYNALHGGMNRWFEPLEAAFLEEPGLQGIISSVARLVAQVRPADRWFVEVHQVRIDTASGIGRPTPEGAHRDGVDFAAVWLAGREDVRGGETRVFEAHGPYGVRFTMTAAGSVMVLDDRRVIHETTPILPGDRAGTRDTLVVTYRAGGFLEPG
jgi:hypothetical protein